MERLDGGSAVPERLRGGIVALGNFDGFHKGHQAVVGRAIERARAEGRPALVATFEPHPMRYFRPDSPPFRLTSPEQRARLIEAAGVDGRFVFQFDADFASLTAPEFVTAWLVRRLGVGGVEAIHAVLDLMHMGGTAADMRRVMHIHPTVAELIPTVMGELGD